VQAEAGLERVTLNGRRLTLREAGAQFLDIRETLSVPVRQNSYSVTLVAGGLRGQERRETLRWQLDQQAPEILLARPLVDLPAENRVTEQAFPVSGTVRETNLASFQINGEDVALEPAGQPGEYRFSSRLTLQVGQVSNLLLEARDQ